MPRFAVMTFMFEPWWTSGRMSIEQLLEGLADAGAEGVEPFHLDFVKDPSLTKSYRRWLGELGLKAPAVDVMCNLVYADAQQKQRERDELRRGLEICKELGSEIAHVAGHQLRDAVSPDDGRKMIAEGLLEAAELADSYGLVLAIEDFNPSPTLVCAANDCLEILRLTDYKAKLVFDTGNFLEVGERADEVFDLVADQIVHCHFKDFEAAASAPYRACDLGKGQIPNPAIAAKLTERGYDGWVALETMGRNDVDPVTAVRRELPLLKQWFGLEKIE